MDRMKAVLVMSAAMIFAASPFFAGAFSGFEPSQFPVAQVDPPIVPAGYAFAIWGLIYAYLLIHAGFGLLKRDTDPIRDAVRWPLIISLTVGGSWITVAKTSPFWATVLIWVMLVSALVALLRSVPSREHWLMQVPLAIYAGWLTAASFVSVGLVGAGYGVFTDQYGWAGISLSLALLFAGVIQLRLSRIPAYGLTVSWALIAIGVRNADTFATLSVLAFTGAAVIGGLALFSWLKHPIVKAA